MTAVGDVKVAPLHQHPAKYSGLVLDVLRRRVDKELKRRRDLDGSFNLLRVIDPMAGVGGVHQLARRSNRPGGYTVSTLGVEIEPEWAACHERTECADALEWLAQRRFVRGTERYQLARMWVMSPTYGNRMADHHEATDDSVRHGYRFDLGRMPSAGSSATLHYGPDYWEFHAHLYRLMLGASPPGTRFALNVSDFIRGKTVVPAATWHLGAAIGAGWLVDRRTRVTRIATPRLGHGENHDARVPAEMVFQFYRDEAS